MNKYVCKFPGCDYSTDNRYGFAGHANGHRKDKAKEQPQPVPPQPTAQQIAAELLKQVVDNLKDYNTILHERNYYRGEAMSLQNVAAKAKDERDRTLKIHNEIIKTYREQGKVLPSVDEVARVLRRESRPGDKL